MKASIPHQLAFQKRTKILTILLLLTLSESVSVAQCNLKLSVQAIEATCQANGEIHCSLMDTAGQGLEQIKYYYTMQDGTDSIVETSLPDITHLKPGTYKVKVSALCRTGMTQEDAYDIVSDSITNIIISSSYHIPSNGIIYNLYNLHAPYGIVPSFRCANTGKVQVQIEDGVFPYTIDLWKTTENDTIFIRTITFERPQGSGTVPYSADYQHYYTIDNLGAGDYLLRCHDGCGYCLPSLSVTIPTVKFSINTRNILLRNSAFNSNDSNIVVFKTNFSDIDLTNNTFYYYLSNRGFEYRFINTTLDGSKESTSWRIFPDVSLGNIQFTDTLKHLHDYGEIWGKEILFQLRPVFCEDTILEFPFTIYPEGRVETSHSIARKIISQKNGYRDECGFWSEEIEAEQYASYITHAHLNFICADSINCWNNDGYSFSGSISNNFFGMRTHSYVTLPIRYKISDITRNEVIASGESNHDTQTWSFYYEINKQYDGDSLITEMTDAHGSPIETYLFKYSYYLGHLSDSAHIYNNEWIPSSIKNDCVCPGCEQSIGLYQYHGLTTPYSHNGIQTCSYFCDTIQLIASPRNNFYNFKASSGTLGHWDVIRKNPQNKATIVYEDYCVNPTLFYPAIRITDTNLLDGDYIFVINFTCDREPDTVIIHKQDYKVPVIAKAPVYKFDTICSRLDITPISGSLTINGAIHKTYFQYFTDEKNIHTINAIDQGRTLSIGTSGEYRLAMYALPSGNTGSLPYNPCYVIDTIITWDENTIEFDQLISYVCNASDKEGFVRARGKKGTLPYSYKVYSEPDGKGILLGENSTGKFDHLPIRFQQRLSIEMIDNCNAHFITNFTVNDMETIRKGWAEDNLNPLEICEGKECHLYGLSIPGVSYRWTGPDGFADNQQNPTFLIQRNCACAGNYYLTIDGTGCGLVQDSVEINILEAPKVELSSKPTFCLGEDVKIFVTPTGTSPISYTLRLEEDGQELTLSQRKSGDKDTLDIGNNSTIQVIAVEDSRCRYELPEEAYHLSFTNAYPSENTFERTVNSHELPYLWDEHLFTQEDTFVTSHISVAGCDSIVNYILHVIVSKICPTATDYDGHEYSSVLIDGLCWLQENLRSRHYSDGRYIEDCHPYFSYAYPDTLDNEEKFGLLYSHTATIDPRNSETPQQGACPAGWRLPTIAEYEQLFLHDFKALRSDRYWLEGRGGNNSTGFSALPAGFFNQSTNRYENLLGETRFWAQNSHENSENIIVFTQKDDCFQQITDKKQSLNRYSIRCILEE